MLLQTTFPTICGMDEEEVSFSVTPGLKSFSHTIFYQHWSPRWRSVNMDGWSYSYKKAVENLEKTIGMNDVAERGVKLIADFNNILKKD